jgi:hypothetical protein
MVGAPLEDSAGRRNPGRHRVNGKFLLLYLVLTGTVTSAPLTASAAARSVWSVTAA